MNGSVRLLCSGPSEPIGEDGLLEEERALRMTKERIHGTGMSSRCVSVKASDCKRRQSNQRHEGEKLTTNERNYQF
jgi:hypothetical protein